MQFILERLNYKHFYKLECYKNVYIIYGTLSKSNMAYYLSNEVKEDHQELSIILQVIIIQ